MRFDNRSTLKTIAATWLGICLVVGLNEKANSQYFPGSPVGYGYGAGFPRMGIGQVGFGAVGFPAGFGYSYGSPAFGWPGFGYGHGALGYGGIGYGGIGYGYGGWGGYGGLGYAPGGMSLADAYMMKSQMYSMNAAQFNLMNAQAATAYQAANLLNQKATETLLNNYTGGKYFGGTGSDRMPVSGNSGYGTGVTETREPRGDIPFNELFSRDGQVLWPLGTPSDGDLASKREAADTAIGEAVRDFAEDRRVSVRKVVEARNALGEFAVPAAEKIKGERPGDYDDWVNYVSSLDRGLRTMAGVGGGERSRQSGGTPAERTGAIETRPENAPKSAGEVLRDAVKDDQGGTTRKDQSGGAQRKPGDGDGDFED